MWEILGRHTEKIDFYSIHYIFSYTDFRVAIKIKAFRNIYQDYQKKTCDF